MSDNDIAIELNPELDRGRLAESFRRNGRVHIENILTEASARRLHYALEKETPWGLIFNEGSKTKEYESVSPDDHQAMLMGAWERAHNEFQMIYHYYRVSQRGRIYPDSGHYLRRLAEFLSAPQIYKFIHEITGADVNGLQSCTATLFNPLHFLMVHDDNNPERERMVAYSLNMTPKWRPDWGGALHFFNNKDQVEDVYLPEFNALNLFRVPKRHSVSQVSAFGGSRYSIAGWFESIEAGRT
jgi:Rps23 Pro-64 3,4-dihydroxylase Tpa1-like proline 4-hydroxylase